MEMMDLVIANAGINIAKEAFKDVNLDELEMTYRINVSLAQ